MAKLKPIRIDDQIVTVDKGAPLARIVPAEVQSVRTAEGALITRDQFARVPIPEGFETNLSAINKGAAPDVVVARARTSVSAAAAISPHRAVPGTQRGRTDRGTAISPSDDGYRSSHALPEEEALMGGDC